MKNILYTNQSIDIEDLGSKYYDKGSWYIGYIPLNLIKFRKWNEHRYEDNKLIISKTNSVKPIILDEYDNINDNYYLIDGNHRCFCAKELGYTHISAIISTECKDNRILTNVL